MKKKQRRNAIPARSSENEKLNTLKEIFQSDKPGTSKEQVPGDDSQAIALIIKSEQQKRRQRWLIGSTIILFLCIITSIAGFFYFQSYNPMADEKITLEIEAPDKIAIGSELTYKLHYENQGNIPISNTKLIVKEPAGWNYLRSVPAIEGHSFNIGDVPIGGRGTIELTGILIDDLNNNQKLTATLIFVPNNFNSEFSIIKEHFTSLLPINLELQTKAVASTTPGANYKAELTIINKEDYTIPRLKIALVTPETFHLEQTSPKVTLTDPNWIILNLIPGAEQKIIFSGNFPKNTPFTDESSRDQKFGIRYSIPSPEDIFYPAGENALTTRVVEQALTTHLIVNGTTMSKNIDLSDKLHITVGYKNGGSVNYQDISLALVINTAPIDIIDWNKMPEISDGHLDKTATGKIITWTIGELPELGTAHHDGTIDITLPLKNSQSLSTIASSDLANLAIELYSELRLKDSTGVEQPTINSSKLTLQLNSDTTMKARAYYFLDDGTPIGAGPLPPEVNQETTYEIAWSINNTIHEIKNVLVTTTLPENVSWISHYNCATGEMTYDPATRKVAWSINRLPRDATAPHATFQATLKPRSADVGKLMKLTESTSLMATDAVTLEDLLQTYGILSSNLDQDAFGTGRGIVIK